MSLYSIRNIFFENDGDMYYEPMDCLKILLMGHMSCAVICVALDMVKYVSNRTHGSAPKTT